MHRGFILLGDINMIVNTYVIFKDGTGQTRDQRHFGLFISGSMRNVKKLLCEAIMQQCYLNN